MLAFFHCHMKDMIAVGELTLECRRGVGGTLPFFGNNSFALKVVSQRFRIFQDGLIQHILIGYAPYWIYRLPSYIPTATVHRLIRTQVCGFQSCINNPLRFSGNISVTHRNLIMRSRLFLQASILDRLLSKSHISCIRSPSNVTGNRVVGVRLMGKPTNCVDADFR